MINHGRTLLLNLRGDTAPAPDFPGEEVIPPDYIPRVLDSSTTTVRRFLFGTAPDRLMLNYRARQLLSLIHANRDLEPFLTDLDPRITYWPVDDRVLFDQTFGDTVTQVAGGVPVELEIVGGAVPENGSGQLQRQWQVTVTSATTALVTQYTPTPGVIAESYAITDGLSSLIPVNGAGFSVRFPEANVGTSWLIDSVLRPTQDLGQLVVSLEDAGEPAFLDLFGSGPAEPMRTFRNLWRQNPQLSWKLAGLVLGLIYHMDELAQQPVQV